MKKLFMLFIGCLLVQNSLYTMDGQGAIAGLDHDNGMQNLQDARVVLQSTRTPLIDNDDLPDLHQAARHGDSQLVEALLESRVDVNLPDNHGCTALWWAAFKGHRETVQTLLNHGATNQSNNGGETPSQWAEYCDNLAIAMMIRNRCAARQAIAALCEVNNPKLGANSLWQALPHWLMTDIFEWLKKATE